MYFYSDTSVKDNFTHHIDFSRVNSTSQVLKHYENLLTLEFFLKSPKDFNEKRDIEKEILICERKIKWWKEQWNFSQEDFLKGVNDLKRKWR